MKAPTDGISIPVTVTPEASEKLVKDVSGQVHSICPERFVAFLSQMDWKFPPM
jgi:hypothetical protein